MPIKMNWLKFEERLRNELDYIKNRSNEVTVENLYDFAATFQAISNIIGQETGRGYPLPDNWLEKFDYTPKERE